MSSSNNKDKITPVASYNDSDTLKTKILAENKNKAGIYMWTNIQTNKSYIGSAINLSNRFKNYYNWSYLVREIQSNNSIIYRALLLYRHSGFKLDILEYCELNELISREQYYIDLLKPEYNILKIAGSLLGFKHSKLTIETIRKSKLGHSRTEADKLAIAAGNLKSQPVLLINTITCERKEFPSIRKVAEYIGLHHSYLAKIIKANKGYIGANYFIIKKNKN